MLVRSRAASQRHGAAMCSARTTRPGYLTLTVGCGYAPAPVATAAGTAATACLAVATADPLRD
jgi:hypothetical protein